jgi:ArsR family transcriptional regulator
MLHMSVQSEPALGRLFQVLGDSTRLRIAALLAATTRGACVCELTDALAQPQYHVSRHLKTLRTAGLVVPERDGRWVYYRLIPPSGALGKRLAALLRTVSADSRFAGDHERLAKRLALRRHGRCCVWTAGGVVA